MPDPGRHALLICISEYDDEMLCPLPSVEEDAAVSVECLATLGFEVLRPCSGREGRLELPDLRAAVSTFRERVKSDARSRDPLAVVVVACHAVQNGSCEFLELLTSEWSGSLSGSGCGSGFGAGGATQWYGSAFGAGGGAQWFGSMVGAGGGTESKTQPQIQLQLPLPPTFSVPAELHGWLKNVRTASWPHKGLDCLMLFDCCRQSVQWSTHDDMEEAVARGWLPEREAVPGQPTFSSNFYKVVSCDPGKGAVPKGEGGLVREVMRHLRFQLPLAVALEKAVRSCLKTSVFLQRPWVDYKEDVGFGMGIGTGMGTGMGIGTDTVRAHPVLGTEPWTQEDEGDQSDGCLAIALVGTQHKCSDLVRVLSDSDSEEGRMLPFEPPSPVTLGRLMGDEDPLTGPALMAVDISWQSRSFRIFYFGAHLHLLHVNDLAELVPTGFISAFLVNLSEWSCLVQLCHEEAGVESVLARTVAIAESESGEDPNLQNHRCQKVLHVDVMEPWHATRDKVLNEVVEIAEARQQALEIQALGNAAKKRRALELLIEALPVSVRDHPQLKVQLGRLNDSGASCSQVILLIMKLHAKDMGAPDTQPPLRSGDQPASSSVVDLLCRLWGLPWGIPCAILAFIILFGMGLFLKADRADYRTASTIATWTTILFMAVHTGRGIYIYVNYVMPPDGGRENGNARNAGGHVLSGVVCYVGFNYEHFLVKDYETLPVLELTSAWFLLMMNCQVLVNLQDLCLDNRWRLRIFWSAAVGYCGLFVVHKGMDLASSSAAAACQESWWCWDLSRLPFWLLAHLLTTAVILSLGGHAYWRCVLFRGAAQHLLSDFHPSLARWTWCLAGTCLSAVAVLAVCGRMAFQLTWTQRLCLSMARDVLVYLLARLWWVQPPRALSHWLGLHATSECMSRSRCPGRHGQAASALRELANIVVLSEVVEDLDLRDSASLFFPTTPLKQVQVRASRVRLREEGRAQAQGQAADPPSPPHPPTSLLPPPALPQHPQIHVPS